MSPSLFKTLHKDVVFLFRWVRVRSPANDFEAIERRIRMADCRKSLEPIAKKLLRRVAVAPCSCGFLGKHDENCSRIGAIKWEQHFHTQYNIHRR